MQSPQDWISAFVEMTAASYAQVALPTEMYAQSSWKYT
jgi:hypothetical protein